MPTFHYVAEDEEEKQALGGLKHLVQRTVGGAEWTWKKVTVVVDSGVAEKSMPWSLIPESGLRATETAKNGTDSMDQAESI